MVRNFVVAFLVTMFSAGCSAPSIDSLKALGTNEFSEGAWKSSSQEERGKMVFSLVTSYDIESMTVEDVQKLLGGSTAYYEYDEFPAYLVGPNTVESEYGKGYVLAFPFDRETGIVSGYVIVPELEK